MLYVLVLLKNTNVDTKNLHIKIVADPGEHPAHVTKSVLVSDFRFISC